MRIGVGARSTLGGRTFLPENMYEKQNARILHASVPKKIIKIPEFLLYLPEKLTKFRNFTRFFPENCPNFT